MALRVTLDNVPYSDKETAKRCAGAITRRLQAAGPSELTPDEFARAVTDGYSWVAGTYEPKGNRWGRFLGMQLGVLDIDNDAFVLDAKGNRVKDASGHSVKRDLMRGEDGFLDPWDALSRFRSLFGRDPLLMYPSLSFNQPADLSAYPTKCKYRIVFDMGEVVSDERHAKAVLEKLLVVFPEADSACANPRHFYFPSCGRCVLFGEGGATYYAR